MEKEVLKDLVLAAQAGETESLEKLFEASYQDIYYFILKTAKQTELAEDLTQDTFLRITEKLDELKVPEAFVTWSRQIAYHCCTDYFRKRKEFLLDEYEEGQSPLELLQEEDAEFIPHEALDREDLKRTLLEMLDTLPLEQRAAMVLRYYDELSVGQIAQVQNVSEGTVKSRLNYGRKAMAKCVEDYEKKNGVKLHSVAIMPLLLWLFRKQRLAAAAAAKPAVAAAAAAGAKAAAAAGVKLALGTKIALAATAAAAVIAGAAVGISALSPKDAPAKPGEQGDAKYYNGHKYQAFDRSMTWHEAKEYCESLGGHLATVTSAEEQAFLESFGGKYWLGATDEETEGTWRWITGENWSYENWRQGEPNNKSEEHYLAIWPDTWNDLCVNSWEQSGFICEWEN